MRGEVHILVNCPITTFLKEKQHSAMADLLMGSESIANNDDVTEKFDSDKDVVIGVESDIAMH